MREITFPSDRIEVAERECLEVREQSDAQVTKRFASQ